MFLYCQSLDLCLDNIRDKLDTHQRKLVRNVIDDNTRKFKELTTPLKGFNQKLYQTIEDVDKITQTFEALVEFVEVVQKIAELAP